MNSIVNSRDAGGTDQALPMGPNLSCVQTVR